ncbi:MAG TPA: hypothetical protein VLE91_01770 [Candidatus Saccharimonadales bacterium]|nr:hypothetical protein [Candidatus Saccharimonadales bacterium]
MAVEYLREAIRNSDNLDTVQRGLLNQLRGDTAEFLSRYGRRELHDSLKGGWIFMAPVLVMGGVLVWPFSKINPLDLASKRKVSSELTDGDSAVKVEVSSEYANLKHSGFGIRVDGISQLNIPGEGSSRSTIMRRGEYPYREVSVDEIQANGRIIAALTTKLSSTQSLSLRK